MKNLTNLKRQIVKRSNLAKLMRLEKMENKICKTQVHDQTEFEKKPSKERKSPTGNNSIIPETRHFTKRIKIED